MAGRPLSAVPNIFATEGSGTLNNIPLLDADFASIVSFFNDSAIGYVNYGTDTGVQNASVVTLPSAPSAYLPGMTVMFAPNYTSSGACTLNVNGLGVVALVNKGGKALTGGSINQSVLVTAVYDGTAFRLLTPALAQYNFTISVSQSVNAQCLGFSQIEIYCGFTVANTYVQVNLNGVTPGTLAAITFNNGSSSFCGMVVNPVNPQGLSFTGPQNCYFSNAILPNTMITTQGGTWGTSAYINLQSFSAITLTGLIGYNQILWSSV